MTKKYDKTKYSNMREYEADLKKNIHKTIDDQIFDDLFDWTCPHCRSEISVPLGQQPCPVCQEQIDVHIIIPSTL